MFKKVLIANRGEIAVRITRACRELGISPVAVYSDVDSTAFHVRLSKEAYKLGGSKPGESYLNIDKIIDTAKKAKAEAIHPGYGFLAENPEFVKRCEDEGLVFIGPSSESIRIMGNKTEARQKMVKAGVPIIPGTLKPLSGEKDLLESSKKIGFPLLLKASAGGGGKGLRLVKHRKDLLSLFRLAKSESASSFGDSSVYIEKYIQEPHHIEVQILADRFGKVLSLGERECSIQRRYQKVMEETPSPFLDHKTRKEMEQVAVEAARAVGYQNAGTVEFIVDGNKNFYFLEMNTRLQVEHPITEMVTGMDIVKSQIRIAAGKKLEFSQQDIKPRGSSLECRIYAEDPYNDFMPSPGKIRKLRSPCGGPGIRYDNGTYEGYTVPMDYDPLLSKVISWGLTRKEAIHRMQRALSEYQVYGIVTIIPFFKRILFHPDFYKGNYNTHFLEKLEKEAEELEVEEQKVALIAAGIKSYKDSLKYSVKSGDKKTVSNWKIQGRMKAFSKNL
ncbi:MAG TPA: acetyl-CoA carboxylase biotin carboxylase subunit [Acidobacteriota bacterium]|nr:acetyl-CoA carboxylase biotin carboxylase subunit [Acidobacteriota bacterium]